MTPELDGTGTGRRPDSTTTRTDAPHVLVVEDEADLAEMYVEWLRDEYDVALAETGAEALDRVDGTVDVVLLDRRLPDVCGRAVLEDIRDRELGCQVVVVSAIDPGVDALELGFDGYLTKPTAEADLRAAIERSLTRLAYESKYREFLGLATKLATIEANMDVDELESCPEYAELGDRFDEMVEELGELPADDEEYRDLYRTKLHTLLDSTHAAAVDD